MDSYGKIVLVLFITPLHVGRALRCACTENLERCASIHKAPMNVHSAQDKCKAMGGELMRAGSSLSNDTIATLLVSTAGYFWTGLEPAATCSNDLAACPQRCLSVSSGKTWTERECEETADGFLCDRVSWRTVCSVNMTKTVILLNPDGCMRGPCEHTCEEVRNGYTCQCKNNYKPSRKDPTVCEVFCPTASCKAICLYKGESCKCPPGFVKDEDNCVDIDECGSNHNCAQICKNTIGSYVCSCNEDHTLVNKSACVPTLSLTTSPTGLIFNPDLNSGQAAVASPGEYVGIVVFIMAALFGLIMLIRYFTKRKPDVGLKDCDDLDEVQQGL